MDPEDFRIEQLIDRLNRAENIPRHVAIIMDGNGRWARRHGVSLARGHREGASRVREVLNVCSRIKQLNTLTLFAFSTENWSRPEREIETLFDLLVEFLEKEVQRLVENRIKLQTIGHLKQFPDRVRRVLNRVIKRTAERGEFNLNLALNYGGRDEIIRAIKRLLMEPGGPPAPEQLSEKQFSRLLDTAGQPEPDLLIRTSGEQRLSNFLLWQLAYSEFYFTRTLWPDFKEIDFLEAIDDYSQRERRFGRRPADGE